MRVRVALAGLLVAVSAAAMPSARAETTNAECTNNDDVTVVIDFQNVDGLDEGVNVRCAPQTVENGRAALVRAGVAFDDFRGFVCRIAGLPKAGPCNNYPPSNAYWVYWVAQRGGDWCASNFGFDARRPPPGAVEGWSFAKNANGKPPKPRYPVPGVIPGTTPNPLTGGDCDSTIAPIPPTTTPVASSQSSPSSPSTTEPRVDAEPTQTARSTRPAAPGATTTSTIAASTTTSEPIRLFVLRGNTTSSIPLGDRDLALKKSRKDGPPWDFIAGGGIVVGLGLVAVVLRRRDVFG